MNLENITKNKKLLAAICGAIAIILAVIISVSISQSGKINTYIYYEPSDTSIYIDGHKVANNKSISLSAGEHTIAGYADGYLAYQETIHVSEYNNAFIGYLTPINGSIEETERLAESIETKLQEADQKTTTLINKRYPATSSLPYNSDGDPFGLWYELNNSANDVNLIININSGGGATALQKACEKLKEFDPNFSAKNYHLVVENYKPEGDICQ